MDKVQFDMMRLWKDTFADAYDYISVVFDSYYNRRMCFTKYKGDNLISSMLCVGYTFCNKLSEMKCAYQCGLATLPKYRNRGLMQNLIERANDRLYNYKFALSFLIPADDRLRLYYRKFGYVDTAFLHEDNYVCTHIFARDEVRLKESHTKYLNYEYNGLRYVVLDVTAIFANINIDVLNVQYIKIHKDILNELYSIYVKFVALLENTSGVLLKYSFDDFLAICLDNYISNGLVLCLTDDNSKPLSILFCSNIEEESATVQLQVSASEEAEQILLQILKSFIPDEAALVVRKYDGMSRRGDVVALSGQGKDALQKSHDCGGVVGELTGAVSKVDLKPYAMVKILNVREVLKFAAESYPNSEFSILVNSDTIPENEGLFMVRQGEVQFSPMGEMSSEELDDAMAKCNSRSDWYALTVPELAALLFRHPDVAVSADSVIAVPRLSPVVALMLE